MYICYLCFSKITGFQTCERDEALNSTGHRSHCRADLNYRWDALVGYIYLNSRLDVFVCTSTHDICFSLLGAVEVIYAQVGDTVTLNCPQLPYMYWLFQGTNLAWINSLGGRGINGEICFELFIHVFIITLHCFYQENLFCKVTVTQTVNSCLAVEKVGLRKDWENKLSWSQHRPSLVISNIDDKKFGTYHCKSSSKDNERPVATIKVLKVDGKRKIRPPSFNSVKLHVTCTC